MLKQLLYSDLARQWELEGRPSARPGMAALLRRLPHHRFLPIVLCRVSRTALLRRIPFLPGLLTYLNLVLFGLEISPRCEIGPGIFFPHASGTVVGAWRIGSNVTIFQGVTLGSKELDMAFDMKLRPEVGNNVTLGAGAKILGGIHIGDYATVGANSVVVEAVEPNLTVVGIPARRTVLRKDIERMTANERERTNATRENDCRDNDVHANATQENDSRTSAVELPLGQEKMENQLDLTVVIPSYNTRQLLNDCIASIYEHTRGIRFEIICIDDHSPDGSADMIAETFPEVILVRNQTNQFYVRNNNLGMRMSRARYACLLNSDTLLISNAFHALVAYMDQNPEVAACGPKLLNPDRTVQHCIRHFSGPGTMLLQALNWHKVFPKSRLTDRYYATRFDYSRAQPVDSIGTTAYVIRRSTWENAGLLDERFRLFVSDLAYNFMLKQKGYAVHFTPCAEVVHYGSQSVNQQAQSALRELHDALIVFNEAYDYFGKSWASKLAVRLAVKARAYCKRAEYYLSSDKRVIKGPGAPPRTRASVSQPRP